MHSQDPTQAAPSREAFRNRQKTMAERRAIPQWQNGVVAVGARRTDSACADLVGTAWIVDVEAGLVCTCAHVIMDCYPRAATPLYRDASAEGVAIGVGVGGPIRWWCRADLRYLSLPPTDVGYPHPLPANWPPADDALGLDLAVLRLRNWDGTALDPHLNAHGADLWHRSGDLAVALPLGRSTSDALAPGDDLVMLGYGQGKDMGVGYQRTSTTTKGCFNGWHRKADTGEWLETSLTIYGCVPRSNCCFAAGTQRVPSSPRPHAPSLVHERASTGAAGTAAGRLSTSVAMSSGGLSSQLKTSVQTASCGQSKR